MQVLLGDSGLDSSPDPETAEHSAGKVRSEDLMGLYNFQPRFVPFIKAGTKKHTIRKKRKHPDKPGNTLHLYTGLRLKPIKGVSQAKLILRATCVKVEVIEIWQTQAGEVDPMYTAVRIDGCDLSPDEKTQLARRDGFSDFHEMMNFWDGRLPFEGHIIHWK